MEFLTFDDIFEIVFDAYELVYGDSIEELDHEEIINSVLNSLKYDTKEEILDNLTFIMPISDLFDFYYGDFDEEDEENEEEIFQPLEIELIHPEITPFSISLERMEEINAKANEIPEKVINLYDDSIYWEGSAWLRISADLRVVNFDSSDGIRNEDDLRMWAESYIPGCEIERYEVNNYVHDLERINDDPLSLTDILEGLYGSNSMKCVSEFKNRFNLQDNKNYYDGMPTFKFYAETKKDNIAVYSNEFDLMNGVNSEKRVMCYSGHILEEFPTNPPVKKIILSSEAFVKKWFELIKNKENCVNKIFMYNGAFGKYLKSFNFHTSKYVRDFKNPTELILEVLKPFSCSFNHPLVKNCAIYSGEVSDCAGYDLNAAYVRALERVKFIPIIDNIPLNDKAEKLYNNFVYLCDSFTYKNIKFPASFWYKEEVERLHLKVINRFMIKEFKPFDSKILHEALENYEDPEDDDLMKFKTIDKPKEGIRNKWFETVIKYSLGHMISKKKERVEVYSYYLNDIMNEKKHHTYTKIKDKFAYNPLFYHNVYFAMANEYHKKMIEYIDRFDVQGVFCDCFYIPFDAEQPPESEDYKFESSVEYRNCNKEFDNNPRYINVVMGTAGTGKTTYMKNNNSEKSSLVIIPERKLSLVWDGWNCQTIQYIKDSHFMPKAQNIIIDEFFKFNTDLLSEFIGVCRSYGLNIWMAGDPLQFEQVGITKESKRIYLIDSKIEPLKMNHRNSLNYKEMGFIGELDKNKLKKLFDKYLKSYLVNPSMNGFFESINYCFRTNGEDATLQKYDKLYLEYCLKHHKKEVYARCIKNCHFNDKDYYNGVIYVLPLQWVQKHTSTFKISNNYSIYSTQGQTMSEIRLIADDEKYYFSSWRMLYVLISRLSNV